jgi:hypothetical protein
MCEKATQVEVVTAGPFATSAMPAPSDVVIVVTGFVSGEAFAVLVM